MGLDMSRVGNHEFDEGVTELLRMQNGGCHPVDGCYFPESRTPARTSSGSPPTSSTMRPARRRSRRTGSNHQGCQGRVHRYDARRHRPLVAQAGIHGWTFVDEVETANALVPVLKAQGVEAIVVLLHEGGRSRPAHGDVNACNGISGPIVEINHGSIPRSTP